MFMLIVPVITLLGTMLGAVLGGLLIAIAVHIALAQTQVRRQGLWVAASLLLYTLAIALFLQRMATSEKHFEERFGFSVPYDVRHLRIQSDLFAIDYGYLTMRFEASEQTVARIVARGMSIMPDAGRERHFRREFSATFSSEEEDLFYDPATGKVFYEWTGID
jgi:hypothetical protein